MNSTGYDTMAGLVFEPVELTEEDKKNRVFRFNVQFPSNSAQNRCPECKFCDDYIRGVELLKVAVQKSIGLALGVNSKEESRVAGDQLTKFLKDHPEVQRAFSQVSWE